MITFNWAHRPKFSGIDNLKRDFLFLVITKYKGSMNPPILPKYPLPLPLKKPLIFPRRVTKGLIITSTSYETQNRISQTSFSLHILKKVEGKDEAERD